MELKPIGSTFYEYWQDNSFVSKYDKEYLDKGSDVTTIRVTLEVVDHLEVNGKMVNVVKEVNKEYI